jgi:hypothetical protein
VSSPSRRDAVLSARRFFSRNSLRVRPTYLERRIRVYSVRMSGQQPYRQCGMELWDLLEDPDFANRPRRAKDATVQIGAFRRIADAFERDVEFVAQQLVNVAVECCGAESSGVSLEEGDDAGNLRFRWIAIAGTFSHFLNGTTPRFFSPCGTTLGRGRPQLYTVTKEYYDFLNIEALPITDGILIPWETGFHRGTLWAVCHGPKPVFDFDDYRLLDVLSSFAAVAVRAQYQFRLGKGFLASAS